MRTRFSGPMFDMFECRVGTNVGHGIADNAIGMAAVVGLPKLLEKLGIQLKDDLLLLINSKSLGVANLEGSRGFLETKQRPIRAGICVEGAEQGRLSYSGLGALRELNQSLSLPGNYDWNRFTEHQVRFPTLLDWLVK